MFRIQHSLHQLEQFALACFNYSRILSLSLSPSLPPSAFSLIRTACRMISVHCGVRRKVHCLEMLAWSAQVVALAIAQGSTLYGSATAALVGRGVMWRVPQRQAFVSNVLLANGAHKLQLWARHGVLLNLFISHSFTCSLNLWTSYTYRTCSNLA